MQRMLDALYANAGAVERLDVVVRAETLELPEVALGIVALLPPGRYTRARLCDQLNSAITAHGFGGVIGTVE
ncbi:MAG: hypothetical protein FDZ70_08380 [Actinobacteria bacterium]|nr:MAG: hypothetical protein FDZ70_08380 [Actinomycetota bacterium]